MDVLIIRPGARSARVRSVGKYSEWITSTEVAHIAAPSVVAVSIVDVSAAHIPPTSCDVSVEMSIAVAVQYHCTARRSTVAVA